MGYPHYSTECADRVTAERLAALSRWIDESNEGSDPEAITWGRLAKISEERGEVLEALLAANGAAAGRVVAAFIGATGQNPRKGVTHSIGDVVEELLDVALTALCAVEHMTGNDGRSMEKLHDKVSRVAVRAGLEPAPAASPGATTGGDE